MSQVIVWGSDRRGCAGAVIDVVPDTHVLTPAEVDHPDWRTVRVSPDLTESEVIALRARSRSTIHSRVIYRVDTTGLAAGTVTDLSKAAFLARLREDVG